LVKGGGGEGQVDDDDNEEDNVAVVFPTGQIKALQDLNDALQ
jgi:hypothetical protein